MDYPNQLGNLSTGQYGGAGGIGTYGQANNMGNTQ